MNHTHEFQGQKLVHDHPGGNVHHGYYEHPEDGFPALYTAIPGEQFTSVRLPDGNLRIFEPTEESDDASRMYVLDVLGMSVLLRWTDVRKGENGNDDWTEEDGPPHALRVVVDSDCDSIRPFTGELEVSNGLDTQDWGVIEADEVQPA